MDRWDRAHYHQSSRKSRATIITDVPSAEDKQSGSCLNPRKTSVSQRPFHQGHTQIFIASHLLFLCSVLFLKQKRRKEKESRRWKEERKGESEEGRKRKKLWSLLYILRSFHLLSDFKDGSSHHLVLWRGWAVRHLRKVAEREKPWPCWQDTPQHLGCSSETCVS